MVADVAAYVIVSHGADHWLGENGLSSQTRDTRKLPGFARLPGAQRYFDVAALFSRGTFHRDGESAVENAVPGGAEIGCKTHLCSPIVAHRRFMQLASLVLGKMVGDLGIEPSVRLREGVTVPCHTLRPVAHCATGPALGMSA